MGQKTHPVGLRLGIVKTWDSRWFAGHDYADLLEEDLMIRRYLDRRLSQAGVSKVVIERKAKSDEIELTVAVDPVEIRLRNITELSQARGNIPYTSTGFRECLERGAAEFGWAEARQRAGASASTWSPGPCSSAKAWRPRSKLCWSLAWRCPRAAIC